MTINEKINAMSVKEKAEMLYEWKYGYSSKFVKDNFKDKIVKSIAEWLESEVNENDRT